MKNEEVHIRISDICDEIVENEFAVLLPSEVREKIPVKDVTEPVSQKLRDHVDALLLLGLRCMNDPDCFHFKNVLLEQSIETLQVYFDKLARVHDMKLVHQASYECVQWPADSPRSALRILLLHKWLGLLSDVDP